MMRAIFVVTTVLVALASGVVAAASDSRLLLRMLIIGFIPMLGAASYAAERLTGGDLWQFRAPYPYRWMQPQGETARRRPKSAHRAVERPPHTDDRATLPVAA
jgi:hypothetical protein